MQPSKYQVGILDWLKNGTGNGCCNAVAGSGKSTTLRLAAIALQKSGLLPSHIKIIVFGKANSLDLVTKFGLQWKNSISTLHSAGWSLLKQYLKISPSISRGLIKSSKYKKIAQELNFIGSPKNPNSYLKVEGAIAKDADFVKLIDLVRLTNQEPTPEAVKDICKHFEMPDIYEFLIVASAIAECLKEGQRQARAKQAFDFTDQIWLPVEWNLSSQKWFKPYKFVLVDECQDLNAAQLELSLMLAGTEGRLLYVGDPKQAIMGFAGADNNSYNKIVERTNATELPLSICYRCPRSHIELVKRNFPEIPIEPHEDAAEGSIVQCDDKDLNELLKTGDLVISRKTAPLVSLCIKLIARGIKATVKGKDIGEAIKRDLEEIAQIPGFEYEHFNNAVSQYKQIKFAKYEGLDNEEQLKENLNDKLEALTIIYQSQPNAKSVFDLGLYIDELFSDDTSPVTLSTCHRAKGLEGDRIFIHKPQDLPMTWRNQLDWQLEQENNLLYVALTRSKSELFIVGDADWYNLNEEEAQPGDNIINPDNAEQQQETSETLPEISTQTEQFPEHIKALESLVEPATANELQSECGKQWVNLGLITLDAGTQSRKANSQATINDYADQMREEQWQFEREPLPVLFYDGTNYYPGDGHHRIMAADQAEITDIYCDVKAGSKRDAIFYSTSANKYHGLPRSNADKWNQVEMLLQDEEWQSMSDRAIGEHCGVSGSLCWESSRQACRRKWYCKYF